MQPMPTVTVFLFAASTTASETTSATPAATTSSNIFSGFGSKKPESSTVPVAPTTSDNAGKTGEWLNCLFVFREGDFLKHGLRL
jgi:hypothetical protein